MSNFFCFIFTVYISSFVVLFVLFLFCCCCFYLYVLYLYDIPHPIVATTNLWIYGMYLCMYVCMYICTYVRDVGVSKSFRTDRLEREL